MEMTEASAQKLARLMKRIEASREDGIAVLLALETEENVQAFFTWVKSLDGDPNYQECFEKAIEISGLMNETDSEE